MANNIILETLRAHRQEIGEEQQLARALVAQCQEEIAQHWASFKTPKEQAECAADEADGAHQQQELREAEARLAVAEKNFTLIQRSVQDITEDIQRVQQSD
jgi:hypothetical protein